MVKLERQKLLAELKEVKRNYPDLKIVCTDVKEGAQAFGLIPDAFNDEILTSQETVRMIRFGHLYNSRTINCDSILDINQSPQLQRRTLEDRNFVFTLKHKNEGLTFLDFVKKSLANELPAYLESGPLDDPRAVNTENVMKELEKCNYTVLVVGSKRCHGCLQIEPHLDSLARILSQQIGNSRVQLKKIDI